MRALLLALLLLAPASVIADAAIPGAPVDPAVAQCTAALEKARARLARDAPFAGLDIEHSTGAEEERARGCTPITSLDGGPGETWLAPQWQ